MAGRKRKGKMFFKKKKLGFSLVVTFLQHGTSTLPFWYVLTM